MGQFVVYINIEKFQQVDWTAMSFHYLDLLWLANSKTQEKLNVSEQVPLTTCCFSFFYFILIFCKTFKSLKKRFM